MPQHPRILQDYEKGVFLRHNTGFCKVGVSFVGDKGYNGGNKFKDLVVSGSDVLNY